MTNVIFHVGLLADVISMILILLLFHDFHLHPSDEENLMLWLLRYSSCSSTSKIVCTTSTSYTIDPKYYGKKLTRRLYRCVPRDSDYDPRGRMGGRYATRCFALNPTAVSQSHDHLSQVCCLPRSPLLWRYSTAALLEIPKRLDFAFLYLDIVPGRFEFFLPVKCSEKLPLFSGCYLRLTTCSISFPFFPIVQTPGRPTNLPTCALLVKP